MPTIPNILSLHEDELLYSYLLRLSEANGSTVKEFTHYYLAANAQYANSRIVLDYDVKGFYSAAFDLVLSSFSKNACRALLDVSLLPFYLPTMPVVQQGRAINYFFQNYANSKLNVSLNSFVVRPRLCPKCLAEDATRFIHRAHQLPGVTVCHIHGCELLEYTGHKGRELYRDPPGNYLAATNSSLPYARFCKDFMDASFDCSSKELKAAISNRLSEMGYKNAAGYKAFAEQMVASGYGDICHADFEKFVRAALVSGQYINTAALMCLLLFLFNNVATLKSYLPASVDYRPELLEKMGADYELVDGYRSDIIHLRHSACGADYFVSPKAFIDGWECPCTYRNDTVLLKNILEAATRNEYTLLSPVISSNRPVSMYHIKCGNLVSIKPRSFLFEGARCKCAYTLNPEDVARTIASLGDFQLASFTSTCKPIKILHIGKGHIFESKYHSFVKHPGCKKCHPRVKTDSRFKDEVTALVGDEYIVTEPYVNKDTKVKILHTVCGKTNEYLPRHFLDGLRCPFCSREISTAAFHTMVSRLSDGRYQVTKQASANLFDILDRNTGEHIALSKQKALQELTRATPSTILPLDFPCKPLVYPKTEADRIWDAILSKYGASDIIFLEDISFDDMPYSAIKNCIAHLSNKGFLKKVSPGVCVYPEFSPTIDQLIEARYINRNGTPIGYWAQPAFAYSLGLSAEKPAIPYIVTNKEASKTGRLITTFGQQIKVRAGRTVIDEKNCRLLPLLDILATGRKYVSVPAPEPILISYIKDNKIDYEDFLEYLPLYPKWVKDGLYSLYRKGIWI